jgi:hypothetical protein
MAKTAATHQRPDDPGAGEHLPASPAESGEAERLPPAPEPKGLNLRGGRRDDKRPSRYMFGSGN